MATKKFQIVPQTQTLVQVRLRPGAVRPHPITNNSQAHPGVSPLDAIASRNTSFQPLPRPLGLPPYHYSLTDNFPEIAQNLKAAKKMVFHVLGDSGGIVDGEYQNHVVVQMISQLVPGDPSSPQFCYHVGDVVYFTGSHDDYYAQFYEPYSHYTPPILSIPGNHDGEVDNPALQTSLDGWVDYFMQAHPDVDPISKDAPRVGLNLPNPYWTLTTPFATFIGMYSNVPEGGSIDSTQQQWITNEFATAPKDLPIILAMHHPIYSFDVFHSGSSKMADVLENAIRDTGRVPNLVLAGHVHDYQRIEKTIAPSVPTPFIVTGNGGYHNLHALHSKAGDVAPDTGAVLRYGNDKTWGFLTLVIDGKTIIGSSTQVDKNGKVSQGDSFSYPVEPVTIANKKNVPTL
ncbi:MAG: acid phosphatase type 7 [Acidobacteriaceae bacterium]|nr:acid phosphatase type 7 [Acidobacteriaceae bacterium]